jgi:hypothetical protein
MNTAMISITPNVLTRILALRMSETESLDDVLRRTLPPISRPVEAPASRATSAKRTRNGGGIPYQIDGELHLASDATDATISILNELAQYDDNFFSKLAAKVQGRTRNHIAQSRSGVYPARPDLARHVKEISSGWFMGCNIANREKEKILRAACAVMGIAFGRYIKIEFPQR